MIIKSYSELKALSTFEERYNYLRMRGRVGQDIFGFDRVFNQMFYTSREWKRVRDIVIARDNGCDLGVNGYDIYGPVIIHHMNPISLEDIQDGTDFLMNPEYLITTCHSTHNAIHYGNGELLGKSPIVRKPYDTCPWKS